MDSRFRLCTRDYASADDEDARVEGASLVLQVRVTLSLPPPLPLPLPLLLPLLLGHP